MKDKIQKYTLKINFNNAEGNMKDSRMMLIHYDDSNTLTIEGLMVELCRMLVTTLDDSMLAYTHIQYTTEEQ